ncbi:MAG: RagB/SusD family nutrient uptake outer membrane protein [Rikenellaceae bacterium]|nr:RagB/SusD family nutrient uptake outer membrane protein [Rikenellaceae bacterium]
MKTKNISKIFSVVGVILLASCNSFLDKIPDQRTDINNEDKVTKLLVSAYSISIPGLLHDWMSDNITDNGVAYGWYYDIVKEAYNFEDVTTTSADSPYTIWEENYKAIASANLALQAIEELEAEEDVKLDAQRAEALLCRAYAHFTLANTFCQAYNPQSSSTDLGIPYMYEVETTAINEYERGTVAEVYKNIFDDIETALPLVDDNIYVQPAYHFNRRAAYAFAAQFNLYYGKYDLAAEYATTSIGEDPTGGFRDITAFVGITARGEMTNIWVNPEATANIMLQGIWSVHGRNYGVVQRYSRFGLPGAKAAEIFTSAGPWGTSSVFMNNFLYGNSGYNVLFPKRDEYFVYSDASEGIGTPYNMTVPFNVEKTIIDRAEAYTMMGEYELAARDLSYFYVCYGVSAATVDQINDFYAVGDSRYVKDINPRFDIQPGMQENFIHACLHARRIATVHEGGRTLDIKRFGIRYTHYVDNGADINIEPFDPRLAIQIPDLVASAGMQRNPR